MERWDAISLFLLGGAAYVGIELAWRGTSHITMFAAGGLCLWLLAWLNTLAAPLPLCAALGAFGVTLVEFATGLTTRALRLRVWDYSHEWGNVAGLICPKYTVLWFFLCLWVLYAMRLAGRWALPGGG
ncbi:MAG: hypothetical protein PHO10_05095 [Gemmiger sp.]|nr:hypothetical protein [Gemmiger sp.]